MESEVKIPSNFRKIRALMLIILELSCSYSFQGDYEFSKDIASLAVEATLKSKCPGTIYILTSDCEDHFDCVGQELSFWSNPIVIINYGKAEFLESFRKSERQVEKWSLFLQSKISAASNFIFICDLVRVRYDESKVKPIASSEEATSLHLPPPPILDFSKFPKPLIRSVDQVLYFDGSSASIDHGRSLQTQREILKHAEIILFVKKRPSSPSLSEQQVLRLDYQSHGHNVTKLSGATFSAYAACKYCMAGSGENVSNTNGISQEFLGTWQRDKTTIAKYFTIFNFQSQYSFFNYTFNVGYLNYKPYFTCVPKSTPVSSRRRTPFPFQRSGLRSRARTQPSVPALCSGIEWEMLTKMSEELNFKFTLVNFTENGGHGIVYSNDNITGMIGALQNESLDIGIGSIIITSWRNKYVDFTKIFTAEAVVFVIEKRLDIYILGIWLAFQPSVWPVLIVTILSLSILIKFISKKRISFSYGLQFSISPILGQALTHKLVSSSPSHLMKIFLALWWFMSLIIGIFYNTSLITSLITPVTPKEPETLAELIEQGYLFQLGNQQSAVFGILQQLESSYIVSDDDDEEDEEEIEESASKALSIPFRLIKQRLVLKVQEHDGMDRDTGQEQEDPVRGHAIHVHDKIVYVVEESNVEEIDWKKMYGFSRKRIIHERLFFTSYAWAVRSGAPFKRKFDNTIDQLVSVGLLNYWHDQHTRNAHSQSQPMSSSKFRIQEKLGQIKMNLSVLNGAFIFFLIGCAVSGLGFGLELLSSRYSFRFFTKQEMEGFWRTFVTLAKSRPNGSVHSRGLNIGEEIVRAGRNTTQIVNPMRSESLTPAIARAKLDLNKHARHRSNQPDLRKQSLPKVELLDTEFLK